MPGSKKAPQQRTEGLRKDVHSKYSTPTRDSKPIDPDAYVLLRDFPARLRFSYYVDRNGRLRCQAERRAGT